METHKSSQIRIGSPRSASRPLKRRNSPAKSSSPAKLRSAHNRGAKSPRLASKSPSKGGQEDRPIYIMELPTMDAKYNCPECSHTTYKRAHFLAHAKTVHAREYEIFYQCIGCRKRFEQMRECMLHVSACGRIQKAADAQADKDKRKTRQLRSDASPLTIGTSKETEKPSALVEPKRVSKEKQLDEMKEAQDEEAELFNLNPNLKRSATEGESTSEPYSVLIKVPRRDGRFYCPKCNKDFIRKDRTINHCVAEHGRSINFAFQCVYCDKHFDEMRTSSNHIKCCPKAKNGKSAESKQSTGPAKVQINNRPRMAYRPSPYLLPTSNKSRGKRFSTAIVQHRGADNMGDVIFYGTWTLISSESTECRGSSQSRSNNASNY